MSGDPVLVPIARIRCTEEVCPRRVGEVVAMIAQRRAWTHPICIEGTVGALLDGHHRHAAARMLGLARVPVRIFDYAEVELLSWRTGAPPTRAEVLARAVSGELFPFKTTRHVFPNRFMPPISLEELIPDEAATAAVGEPAHVRSAPLRYAGPAAAAERERWRV